MPQHSLDQNIFTEVQGTVQCVLLWAIEDNELFSVKGKNIIEILTWDEYIALRFVSGNISSLRG